MKRLLVILLLIAAGRVLSQPYTDGGPVEIINSYRRAYFSQELGIEVKGNINYMLYDTICNWLGVPYRYSGSCEKGIDCSGFVNVLFDRVYGKRIGARNSAEIYQLTEKVKKDELKEGDLVFFRIYRKRISHVGLYLGQNKFVHASTSKGVIISDLDEPYYKKYFAGGGRLGRETLSETQQEP